MSDSKAQSMTEHPRILWVPDLSSQTGWTSFRVQRDGPAPGSRRSEIGFKRDERSSSADRRS